MAFPKDPTSPLAFISKHAYTCTHTKSSKKPKGSNTLHPEESKDESDCLSKVMQIKKKYLKTNIQIFKKKYSKMNKHNFLQC